MKSAVFHLLCVMLIVASCGGNANRKAKNNQAEAAPEAVSEVVAETVAETVAEPEETVPPKGLAFEVFKQIAALDDYVVEGECPEGCTVSYTVDTDDIEGYYEDSMVDCLPLEGGGWLAIETTEFAAEGEPTSYINRVFRYVDGKLTEVDKDILPVPEDIMVFLSPEACEGKEELVETLKAAYEERPASFLVYHCSPTLQNLRVELRPLDPYTEEYKTKVWPYEVWELRKEDSDFPVYSWDGRQFVK